MQLSEKFRRGVVVATDEYSAQELARFEVSEKSRVRFLEIGSQSDFETIWETGFFDSVNEVTGCTIDDYEEEVVPAALVSSVMEIAISYREGATDGSVEHCFFTDFAEICQWAVGQVRSIYFVL